MVVSGLFHQSRMVCVKIKLYIYLASLSLISQWFCSCFKVEEERRRLDPVLRILDESIANARGVRRTSPPEPSMFDDDEPLGRFQSINFAVTVSLHFGGWGYPSD
jgi:hypothetical protein